MGTAHLPQESSLPQTSEVAELAPQAAAEPWWQWIKRTVTSGGPGQVIFAITNACNAGCGFCNFALERSAARRVAVRSRRRGVRAIDVLHGLFIRYLIVTGGEPPLHPELDEIVATRAAGAWRSILVTNGSRLTAARCRELTAAGVSCVVISVDAAERSATRRTASCRGSAKDPPRQSGD